MENASKALLMAGGMLLAILLISVGVLGYTRIKSFKTTEAEISAKKQIQAFNAEYEAYNRKLLRGIDVISVVNKAISNNEIQDPINDSDPCYVNIVFETKTKFETTVDRSNKKIRNAPLEESTINEYKSVYYNETGKHANVSEIEFEGKEKLGQFINNPTKTEWTPNSEIVDFFKQDAKTITYTSASNDYVYYVYPSLVNFKSEIFECTKIEYNDEGRVYQITFKQK